VEFKKVTYSRGVSSIFAENYKGSDIPYSCIVKDIATKMIDELINKISDMDKPDVLYITIDMDNKMFSKNDQESEASDG
jgi:hypothetical protein